MASLVQHLLWTAVVFALLAPPMVTRAELYSALVDLKRALGAEQDLGLALHAYVTLEEQRLADVRVFADQLLNHSSQVLLGNSVAHLANPVNAFLLVKRLALDWRAEMERLVTERAAASRDQLHNELQVLDGSLPDGEDLKGAMDALLRLQDTYQLPTRSIARGWLGQDQNETHDVGTGVATEELSADECFIIGKHAYDQEDLYHTGLWMDEALSRLGALNVTAQHGLKTAAGVQRSTILDYLVYSLGQLGNNQKALVLTNEWLTLEPDHERAHQNRAYYQQQVREEFAAAQMRRGDTGDLSKEPALTRYQPTRTGWYGSEEYQRYLAQCRDETPKAGFPLEAQRTPAHKLFCHLRVPHPHYLIGPVREEELALNPRIVMFYDVVHPQEIHRLQEMAAPRLNRATVQHPVTGKLVTAHYRVSKSAWLTDEQDWLVHQLNRRIDALTGLSVETAEDLQVVNYGIGGQYEPHFDFARRKEKGSFGEKIGNRIATLLVYMSTVERGGATVFTEVGVNVRPVAGAAAFWYNLWRNGDGVMSTRHAACPVLLGSKWVMNKWFHERGQEWRRPCALDARL